LFVLFRLFVLSFLKLHIRFLFHSRRKSFCMIHFLRPVLQKGAVALPDKNQQHGACKFFETKGIARMNAKNPTAEILRWENTLCNYLFTVMVSA